MKRILSILFLAIISLQSFSQSEKYSRIKITADKDVVLKLMQLGTPVEDGIIGKDHDLTIELSKQEINNIANAGLKYDILIDDVKKFYRDRFLEDQGSADKVKSLGCNEPPQIVTPAGFHLGTMGGFYTYQQINSKLDSLALQYPTLITLKQPADALQTIEGRTVYYVKISDNPNVNENEPEVLYTGITHAREGVGMQQLFFYMCYLLENYNTNSDIKHLVDNTEMYFIPCVNPDGYVYNQTNDPGGGGMWRKNRRNNGNFTYGVDLNRNFGYNWGIDDLGSSPNGWDDTYRGTAGFSEPESQIIRNFCIVHQIKTGLNEHAYGNDLIYPWGYIGSTYTPDSLIFKRYARMLTKDNYYINGTCDQTLGYIANGGFDDWMYGDQTSKPKIISMLPESGTGNDGFWPSINRIPEICRDNLTMNMMIARLAGKYAVAEDISSNYVTQLQGYFDFSIERLGLDSPATYTVSIQPITSNITSVGNQKVFTGMSLLEKRIDSISFILDPSIHNGDKIKYLLKVDNGLYVNSDTIIKVFGPSYHIFSDNGNTMNNWNSATNWDITTEAYYSAPASITDSPYSDYQDNDNNSIKTNVSVNLVGALSAYLSFEGKWAIEGGYDYAQVKISTNNGSTWTPLCGKYTRPGSSSQASGEPLYDGVQATWVKEEMSLDDYLGQNVLFQYSMVSDNSTTMDGFYFDDLKVYALYDSSSAISEHNYRAYYLSAPMPNPASDETNIIYNLPDANKDAVFELTDITGRIIFSKNMESSAGVIKINVTEFSSGLYHYNIHSGRYTSEVKKLVVAGK